MDTGAQGAPVFCLRRGGRSESADAHTRDLRRREACA